MMNDNYIDEQITLKLGMPMNMKRELILKLCRKSMNRLSMFQKQKKKALL